MKSVNKLDNELDKKSLLLYILTDRRWLKAGEKLADAVEKALQGGATFVQLREKEIETNEPQFLAREAAELKALCQSYGVPFVIDDSVELAKAVGADGVHVGQSDMGCAEARRILGESKIVGVSVGTVEQAIAAEAQGADYLGVGAVFPTRTKDDADLVSAETLSEICKAVKIPVIAIGGINAENAGELAGCGLAGIAVISAVLEAEDICEAAKILRGKAEALAGGGESASVGGSSELEAPTAAIQPRAGVVFDVDGTLLNSSHIWTDAGKTYLASLGVEAEDGLGRKLFQMSLDEGAIYMKERYSLDQSNEEIKNGVLKVVEDFYLYEAPLKPGAEKLIKRLAEREIPMVVASSSKREHIEAALGRLGVLPYFKRIFTCDEVGIGKHNPKIFMQCAECMGVTPEKTWVIEDGLYAMKTAKNSGFNVVGILDEESRPDWDEIAVVADFTAADFIAAAFSDGLARGHADKQAEGGADK